MRSLIKWFVDNPVAANLLMIVLIVGGLISLGWGVVFATIVTLFLVPCLYLALEDFHVWKVPEPTPDIEVNIATDY